MLGKKLLDEILTRKRLFTDQQLMSLAWSFNAMKLMDNSAFSAFREEAVSRGEKKDQLIAQKNFPAVSSIDPINVFADLETYMILNKPSGMVVSLNTDFTDDDSHVMKREKRSGKSLEMQELVAQYSLYPICKDAKYGNGIMHRLDRETTGALLVAKTYSTYYDLRLQFACNRVYKQYACIVHGWPVERDEWRSIRSPLSTRKFAAGDMTSCVDPENGLPAHSEYKVINRLNDTLTNEKFSLVHVRTHTGRTHQIRAHMESIGHPLLNDRRYGETHASNGRVKLHASEIGFLDEERPVTYTVPLPNDFQAVLDSLAHC